MDLEEPSSRWNRETSAGNGTLCGFSSFAKSNGGANTWIQRVGMDSMLLGLLSAWDAVGFLALTSQEVMSCMPRNLHRSLSFELCQTTVNGYQESVQAGSRLWLVCLRQRPIINSGWLHTTVWDKSCTSRNCSEIERRDKYAVVCMVVGDILSKPNYVDGDLAITDILCTIVFVLWCGRKQTREMPKQVLRE